MTRVTKADRIKQLEAERDHAKTAATHNKDGWDRASRTAAEAIAVRDHQARQLADLQERLAAALSEADRMRGYIERVQEDDVVREDLVTTGDPAGEQVLEPKRRPTRFARPGDHSPMGAVDDRFPERFDGRHRDGDRPRKLLHWIRYGRSAL
jgi:hypothetical protein